MKKMLALIFTIPLLFGSIPTLALENYLPNDQKTNVNDISMVFDTLNYSNQNAKLAICVSDDFPSEENNSIEQIDGEINLNYYNYYYYSTENPVNGANEINYVIDLSTIKNKFEVIEILPPQRKSNILVYDVTNVSFTDDENFNNGQIDFSSTLYKKLDREFCQNLNLHPDKVKVGGFTISSLSEKTYRTYNITAKNDIFSISALVDVAGKDITANDVTDVFCKSGRDDFYANSPTQNVKIFPIDRIVCRINLKPDVYYNEAIYFDKASQKIYPAIIAKIGSPSTKYYDFYPLVEYPCYLETDYQILDNPIILDKTTKSRFITCNLMVPIDTKEEQYSIDLDFFATNAPTTIAQTTKSAGKITVSKPDSKVFDDVNLDSTFASYMEALYKLGIVRGNLSSDSSKIFFEPNKNITRGEMGKIVFNAWERQYSRQVPA